MPETCRVSWQNKIIDTWCILLVIYTKNGTVIRYNNIQIFGSPRTWFRLFQPYSGKYSTNKNTEMASCTIFVHEMLSYNQATTTTFCTALCIVFYQFSIYIVTLSLLTYNITIIVCLFFEDLPEDGWKRPKHVAGLSHVCTIIVPTYGVADPSARAV